MIRTDKSSKADQYAHMVSDIPDLTKEQEAERFYAWKRNGDTRARDELIESCLKMSVAVSRKLCYRVNDFDDYMSAGNIGIMRALKRFDPKHGVSFRSYAWHWIRSEINLMYLRNKFITQGGACLRGDILFTINRLRARIEATTNDREEICRRLSEELDQPVKVVQEWIDRLDQTDLSLDYVASDTDRSMLDMIGCGTPSPEQNAEDNEQSDRIRRKIDRAIRTLPPREQQIVRRRYLNQRTETLQQIGDSLKISRERARQLEAKALKKLRRAISLGGYEAREVGKIIELFAAKHREQRKAA